MRHHLLSSALAVALAFGPVLPVSYAATYNNGTNNTTFNVTLTLQPNCTISANPLSFGSSGTLTTAVNQTTTLAVTCSNSTPYNLGLDAGNVPGSTVGTRFMAGTTSGNTGTTVSFQLYQDPTHSTIWGNTQGTDTVPNTGTGAAQSFTVWGQVPTQTTPKPDSYQSTVQATVYF